MVSLQEIREQVENLKEMLKDVKTIEDCRNLRHKGFSEDEIVVEVEKLNVMPLKDAMEEYKDWDNTRVMSIGVKGDNNISFLVYNNVLENVCFDVYDKEYDEEYNMLEDVLLEELEDVYNEAMESIMEERT